MLQMQSQPKRSGGMVLYLAVVYISTLMIHDGACSYICSSEDVKIPAISARKPASAYQSGTITEFRIHKVFTKELEELDDFEKIKKEYIEPGFEYWQTVLKPKVPTVGTIKLTRKCATDWFYPVTENGVKVKYCKDDCQATVTCSDFDISHEYVDDCRRSNGKVKENAQDGGKGVNNTDLLVFIGLSDTGCGLKTLAHALTCQRNAETDRPEVAYINYCKANVKFQPQYKGKLQSMTAHELGHALGFSASSYAYMRDAYGNPRTPREKAYNQPSLGFVNGYYRADTNTVAQYNKSWPSATGSHTLLVSALKTENILKAARKHFKCDSITGVELENNGGPGGLCGHLEKSLYNDEIMVATSGEGYVSELTLAFMKDTGWYHVNMSMAQRLPWGYKKGCTFAKNNCYSYMNIQRRHKKSYSPWCDKEEIYCQRNGMLCNLRKLSGTLPTERVYFKHIPGVPENETNIYGSADYYMDYCPYLVKC